MLMEVGVNERSIAQKLPEYLQEQFPDWDVDLSSLDQPYYNRTLARAYTRRVENRNGKDCEKQGFGVEKVICRRS